MAERPVLRQLNIVARDVPAMVAFYERLGLEVPAGPDGWERDHVSPSTPAGLDLDLDSREFAATWNAGWDATRTGVVIGFEVHDRDAVDRTYAELTGAGYAGQQEPYDAFWGARYAVVSDPDGNAVGLMSPIDPARRSTPPEPPS